MIQAIIFDFSRTLYDPDADKLMDGAFSLLASLKERGVKLGLISRTSGKRKQQLDDLKLAPLFDAVITVLKPDDKRVEHFTACAAKLGLPHHQIAVVGDRTRKEIKLGNQLGMTTVWYKQGKYAAELPSSKDEEPRHTIVSLGDMMKYL